MLCNVNNVVSVLAHAAVVPQYRLGGAHTPFVLISMWFILNYILIYIPHLVLTPSTLHCLWVRSVLWSIV